jgi:hypothetical protein
MSASTRRLVGAICIVGGVIMAGLTFATSTARSSPATARVLDSTALDRIGGAGTLNGCGCLEERLRPECHDATIPPGTTPPSCSSRNSITCGQGNVEEVNHDVRYCYGTANGNKDCYFNGRIDCHWEHYCIWNDFDVFIDTCENRYNTSARNDDSCQGI